MSEEPVMEKEELKPEIFDTIPDIVAGLREQGRECTAHEVECLYETHMSLIAHLSAKCKLKSPWILITPETLPEEGQWVIATDGTTWRKMQMSFGKLSFSGSHAFDDNVIAYMPIPPLPEK